MEAGSGQPISSRYLVLCLILLTIGFRIVRLSADPPADFDWSGGYFADEGYWSHNARNAILFQKPVQDDWDGRVMSPLFVAVQSTVFQYFGIGLIQVRFIGILSALLLTIATFYMIRRRFGETQAFLCSVLVSLSYPMLVLARQGILDPFSSGLAWIAFALAAAGTLPCAFLAGVFLISALTTKFLMAYSVVPICLALFIGGRSRNRWIAFGGGAVLAAAVWLIAIYLPNRDLLQAYNRFYASQQAQNWAPVQVMKNIVMQPFYLYGLKTPVLLLLGNLMAWYVIVRFRDADGLERAICGWVICGVVFFALWRYRPVRYYTPLFAPMAALAGIALMRLDSISAALQTRRTRLAITVGLLLPAVQAILLLGDRLCGFGKFPQQLGIHSFDAGMFVILSACLIWILLFSPARTKWIAWAFLAAFVLCDLRSYAGWMIRPEYSAEMISADLESRLPEHAVISGQWAPELVLNNRLKAVPVWKGFVNSDDPFRRYGVTHLLLWRYPLGDEYLKFNEWYPEEMKRFHKITTYTIKNSALELYEREVVP